MKRGTQDNATSPVQTAKRQRGPRKEAARLPSRAVLLQRLAEKTAFTDVLQQRISVLEGFVVSPMDNIFEEMLYEIFQKLEMRDLLCGCEQVCKRWNAAVCFWLRDLDLACYGNAIGYQVAEHLFKYPNLTTLSLKRCDSVNMRGLNCVSFFLKRLTTLDIFGCNVMDFSLLKCLPDLETLTIGNQNGINSLSLQGLPACLKALTIKWCPALKDIGLKSLGHLTRLQSLTVEQNDFAPSAALQLPAELADTLTSFNVIRQGFYDDEALRSLAPFCNLETLVLYWNPIAGDAFREIGPKLTALHTLVLQRCHAMQDNGFLAVTRAFPRLRSFTMTGVHHVTRDGMKYLKHMTSLKELILGCGKEVIDEGATTDLAFLDFMQLEQLTLIDCTGITGVGFAKIASSQADTLVRLDIRQATQVVGSDLLDLKRLQKLTYFSMYGATLLIDEDFEFWYKPGGGIDFVVDEPDESAEEGEETAEHRPLLDPELASERIRTYIQNGAVGPVPYSFEDVQ